MSLTVRYFAAARELCGCDGERVDIEGPAPDLDGVLAVLCDRHERLRPYAGRMRMAINGEFAAAGDPVSDGDEVSVLPPLAGGSPHADPQNKGSSPHADPQNKGGSPHADPQNKGGSHSLCEVRDTPLSLDDAVAAVSHGGAGGISLFLGVVRDRADGKDVARLDYEAHDVMANREMARVLEEVAAELPGTRLSAQHRIGQLQVGDAAVIIAASAPHRDDAFRACRAAIDRIKERVPIWKHEWAPDGSANWVNLGPADEGG